MSTHYFHNERQTSKWKEVAKWIHLRAEAARGPLGWLRDGPALAFGYILIHPHRPPGPTLWADGRSRDRHGSSQVHEIPWHWKLKAVCALLQGRGPPPFSKGHHDPPKSKNTRSQWWTRAWGLVWSVKGGSRNIEIFLPYSENWRG